MTYSEKISILTGIPVKMLNQVWEATLLYISNELHQQKDKEVKKVIIPPLGQIEVSEGTTSMNCQFIASKVLIKAVTESQGNSDPLQLKLDDKLVASMIKICRNIL